MTKGLPFGCKSLTSSLYGGAHCPMSRKNIDRFFSQIFVPQTLGSPSKQSEASEKQQDITSQATKDITICTG